MSTATTERLNFELTFACDHRCQHCYNVWAAPSGKTDEATHAGPAERYPRGRLSSDEHAALIARAIQESGARSVTLTGGEPLLHPDALRMVETACAHADVVQLITNGSHLTKATVARLAAAKLASVQLTLHAARRERHDELAGAVCFDDTVRAACDLKDAGISVQVCFVATYESYREFEAVLELCVVLGVRGVSYNRMAPSGGAVAHAQALVPTVAQLEENLAVAERLGRHHRLPVTTAMPIPPCLLRYERYPWVRFGFCSTNSPSPNLVIDPLGNVRACNLSSVILGNLQTKRWSQILRHKHLRSFAHALPAICRGCSYATSCRGGCKESGLSTFGALDAVEPLVARALDVPRAPDAEA